jgi:hypothetical protein
MIRTYQLEGRITARNQGTVSVKIEKDCSVKVVYAPTGGETKLASLAWSSSAKPFTPPIPIGLASALKMGAKLIVGKRLTAGDTVSALLKNPTTFPVKVCVSITVDE